MKIIKTFSVFIVSSILLLSIYIITSFPEGVSVLTHYVFGDGEKLELKSDYLPKSPVIINSLKSMKIGETKVIRFSQKKDWRLSYALNPFRLKKLKNGFEIYQYIEFDKTGKVYTIVNLGGHKIKIYDSWINLLNPTPYMLTYSYTFKPSTKQF
jgi:hypothetical protein